MGGALRRFVIYPLVFFAGCSGTLFGTTSWAFERAIEPVEGGTPPSFPIVAVTGEGEDLEAHPLHAARLDSFAAVHPDHSFLIPEARADELRDEMVAGTRMIGGDRVRDDGARPWFADFEIEESGPDHQLVRAAVTYDDDDVNEGWYRATAESFEPLRRRTAFGPGVALFGGILGLVVGSVLVGVVDRVWGPSPDERAG